MDNDTSNPIVVSSASVLVFRARFDVAMGDAVTPENCDGMPEALGLSWIDDTKAGATGRVFVPAFGMDQLPPMPDPGDDDNEEFGL